VERSLEHFREVLRRELPALAERYNVASLAVFGSYVRGENREDSDLDLVVEYSRTPSLFQFVDLQNHLSGLLGIQVDLVLKNALKPRVAVNVLRELQPV
jgi:predicted nucleotidyltransferase